MELTTEEKIALAAKVTERREEILKAAQAQFVASKSGTQQMRYYVTIDPETGKPSTYEHYGTSIYDETVWDNFELLVAEYIADGVGYEDGDDPDCIRNAMKYLSDAQKSELEAWKKSEDYAQEDTDEMDWIQRNAYDAYKKYEAEYVAARAAEEWEEWEKNSINEEIDNTISELQGGTKK